jgi:transcription-repair coupling factor (superfamily II helicase)
MLGVLKQNQGKSQTYCFQLNPVVCKRRLDKGFQFAPDSYLQNELESSLFTKMPDQTKSTAEVKPIWRVTVLWTV